MFLYKKIIILAIVIFINACNGVDSDRLTGSHARVYEATLSSGQHTCTSEVISFTIDTWSLIQSRYFGEGCIYVDTVVEVTGDIETRSSTTHDGLAIEQLDIQSISMWNSDLLSLFDEIYPETSIIGSIGRALLEMPTAEGHSFKAYFSSGHWYSNTYVVPGINSEVACTELDTCDSINFESPYTSLSQLSKVTKGWGAKTNERVDCLTCSLSNTP